MKTYKVDLDYESFLFDPNYTEDSVPNLKIIREFEYIFFLVNQENGILKNARDYEKNYLNKLKGLDFVIPQLDPRAKNAESWWGNRHSYSIEQNLNSKITSAELGRKNNWGFYKGALAKSSEEVEAHIKQFPEYKNWIIKRPHSFSGIGHYQFNSENINKFIMNKIILGEVLVEPLYKRVFDIGTTFVVKDGIIDRQFMVENINSANGGFKGGVGASTLDKFKKYILEKYSYSLDELEQITKEIAQNYLDMGAINNIQIDSFIYEEDGALKLYPLVEVNYRKTMGLVIQTLADKYPDCSTVEWVIRTKKEIDEDRDFYTRSELVRLSPDGTHFQTYLKRNL
jgi:hypothetical protein